MKLKRLILSATLAHAVLAFAQTPASTPDIVGLRLAQTPDQVRPILQSIAPQVRIGQVVWQQMPGVPSSVAALHGTVGPRGGYGYVSADFDEYVQVGFGQATKKAYYVVRHLGANHRQPMLVAELETALLAKYGEPHTRLPGQMIWEFRADGKRAAPSDMCGRGVLIAQGLREITTPPSESCGFTMQVLYSAAPNRPDVVSVLSMGMFDHRLMVEDIREVQRLQSQQSETQRERDRKELKGNTPRL